MWGKRGLPGRVLIIGNVSERQSQGEGLLRWKQKDLAVAARSACLHPQAGLALAPAFPVGVGIL